MSELLSRSGNRYIHVAKRIVQECQQYPKSVHWFYSGGIIVNGSTVPFHDIITIDVHRDFINNFSDIVTVEVMIDTKLFHSVIVPNLENLKGWISRKQMAENSIMFLRGGVSDSKQFKAILHNPPKQGLGGHGTGLNKVTNPDQTVTYATFQFIDLTAIDLKLTTFQGMMELTEPMEALTMVLDSTGSDYDLRGVHRADWDVKNKRQIVIPRGTLVKDLAQYIQQEYGIYNHGIGAYLYRMPLDQQLFWFIYPLYNNNRYETEYYKLSISVVPGSLDPVGVPRTYMVDNGNVTIIIPDEAAMKENKTADQLNAGTGIAFVNPAENRAITTEEVGPNRMMKKGAQSTSTFNVVERKDGKQNIINVYKDTMNTAKLISSIAGNEGNYIVLDWKFANPELLQPGMPVKIQYFAESMKILYGTLHEYHAISVKTGKTGIREVPYNCTLRMIIYVTSPPDVAV